MSDTISKVQSPPFERHRPDVRAMARTRLATDWAAVALLLALTTLVIWNRASFNLWLARVDMLHIYLQVTGSCVLYRTIVSPVGGEWSVRRLPLSLVAIGSANPSRFGTACGFHW